MNYSVTHVVAQEPTVSADQIWARLNEFGSPLTDYAQFIYDCGVQYGVDPAFFMAVVRGENHYGTHPNSLASSNYNWASISNAYYGGWPVEGSRWGQYPSPEAGIEAFFRLISEEYFSYGQYDIYSIWWGVGGSESVTGEHAYAPAFENAAGSIYNLLDEMATIAGTAVDQIVAVVQPEPVADPGVASAPDPSADPGTSPPSGGGGGTSLIPDIAGYGILETDTNIFWYGVIAIGALLLLKVIRGA